MDKVLCIGMNYKDHCEEQVRLSGLGNQTFCENCLRNVVFFEFVIFGILSEIKLNFAENDTYKL